MYDPVTAERITFCCILTFDHKLFVSCGAFNGLYTPRQHCSDHLDEVKQEKAHLCREIVI